MSRRVRWSARLTVSPIVRWGLARSLHAERATSGAQSGEIALWFRVGLRDGARIPAPRIAMLRVYVA